MEKPSPNLSPSERRTLRLVARGEFDAVLDWIALHRLKSLGLVEEQNTGRPVPTVEGRRVLQRLASTE